MDGVIRYLARDALAESLKQAVAKNEPGLWVRAADFDDRQAQAKQREVALQDRLTAAEQQIDEFPSMRIEGCHFAGYNADGTEPFEFAGETVKKLKSINMSGWRCEGPLKKEGMFERDLPNVEAFTSPPTLVEVTLSDDQILEAMREHIYAADGGYVFDTAKPDVIAAGRALIAAVLNNKPPA